MRQLLKSILQPLGLLPLAQKIQLLVKRYTRRIINWWLLARTRMTGQSYTDFYETMMDRRARKGAFLGKKPMAVTGTPDEHRRSFAAGFFAGQKLLTPNMKVLDYGCGNVATGVHFIKYLEPGRYTGADISAACLDVGKHWISEMNLNEKHAALVHLPGGKLDSLKGERFDLIYSQDVIVHMPPENVQALLNDIREFFGDDCSFYFTFTDAEDDVEYQNDMVNWHYNWAFIERAANDAGLKCELVESFDGIVYKGSTLTKMARAYKS